MFADIANFKAAFDLGELRRTGFDDDDGPRRSDGGTAGLFFLCGLGELTAKRLSGLDAAAQVLAEAGKPVNSKTIVERMLERGLWQTNGKTPSATIYAAMIREIARLQDKARFRKVERRKFELVK